MVDLVVGKATTILPIELNCSKVRSDVARQTQFLPDLSDERMLEPLARFSMTAR
jgi:hypothetical protein